MLKTALMLTITFVSTMAFAKPMVLTTAASTYVHLEGYNNSDVTDIGIDFFTDDALEALLAESKTCGMSAFNDLTYYNPMDASEDVGYLYSQPAARLITALQEKTMITAEDFNALSFELNATTNQLMTYLDGKSLNVCAEYTQSAYSGGETVYFVMVDGKVEFAIFVGRP